MMATRVLRGSNALVAAIAFVAAAAPGCSALWGFEDGKPLADGSGGHSGTSGGTSAKGGTGTSHSGGRGGAGGDPTSSGGEPNPSGGEVSSSGGTNSGGANHGGTFVGSGGLPLPQGGESGGGGAGGEGGFAGCNGCNIGGRCVNEGALNEANACLICDAARSATTWSPRDGAACDDKVFCNGADTCRAGTCSQHDGSDPCLASSDTCNATLDACCRSKLTTVCNASGNPAEVDSCGREVRTLDACVTPNGSCVNGACVCAPGWGGDDCSQCVRYVRAGAASRGDGTSWARALKSIPEAIAAGPTCQIWVFEGTYSVPAATGTDPRAATLAIPAGTKIYGGFSGESKLSDRDLAHHVSLLSGDLGVADDPSDDVYHVVTLGDAASLDGFTVNGGNANGTSPNDKGSAIYVSGASASVANCTLSSDLGAIAKANVAVSDCSFASKTEAITVTNGTLRVTRGTFAAGRVVGKDNSNIKVNDSTFSGPTTGVAGEIDAEITDSRFQGNDMAVLSDSGHDYTHNIVLERVTIEGAALAINMGHPANHLRVHASTFRTNGTIVISRTNFTMDGCMFLENKGGFSLNMAGAHVTSSVFAGNTGTFLKASSADPHDNFFTNCTFYGNELAVEANTARISIGSSIFRQNTLPPLNLIITYSDIDNPSSVDPTNFSADPLFVSTTPGALDFRLRAGSPCIDRAPTGSPDLDALGRERYDDPGAPNLNGTSTDLGAYEWRPE